MTEPEAEALMETVWRPGGVWARFVGHSHNIAEPSRYKGFEY